MTRSAPFLTQEDRTLKMWGSMIEG